MTEPRWFPIQGGRNWLPYGQVPWAVAEKAYEVYSAKYGKDQSLEVLARRGGFSWEELVWFLAGGQEPFRPLEPTKQSSSDVGR